MKYQCFQLSVSNTGQAFRFRLSVLAALVLASNPVAGYAEMPCMPAAELEAGLIDWYQEQPVNAKSEDVVLWQSAQGKTWTIVKYHSDGTACTLGQGENWDDTNPSGDLLVAGID